MGEYLAQQGYSVLGVRLAGHATRPKDMLYVRWQDWVTCVEDGYHLLQGMSDTIFLAGLSMGGVLALLNAARVKVAGVIAMSTPFALPKDWRLPWIQWLHRLQPRIEKGPSDWHNPEAALDHIDYPYYPTRAIAELRDLLTEMRASLPKVKVPALIMHSKEDSGVPPHNAEQIYQLLGSQDKSIFWLENSGHVITREPERQRVFQAADEFIRRVTQETS